jgi:hypothetical protein
VVLTRPDPLAAQIDLRAGLLDGVGATADAIGASSTRVERPSSTSFRAAARPAYPPPTTTASRTSFI